MKSMEFKDAYVEVEKFLKKVLEKKKRNQTWPNPDYLMISII